MKTSLKWLNSYLDRPVDAVEAEGALTDAGFPLESVEPRGDDFLLDVEVTSNRSDCLSHIGVAREVAAATGRTLREPAFELKESGTAVETLASVENREAVLCPHYTARVITGLKVGPSPRWLVERLESIGLRSVNNIVDVTNFVLHEMGQPLHAFDLGKLEGRQVVVRRAAKGEPFTAIDGSKHALRPDTLVIADADKPQAVAGIMGGLESEVTTSTTEVLLESARFDPLNIRTSGRAMKLASDSSYRFERGLDPAGVERASRRAAQLILDVAGGTLAHGVIAIGQPLAQPRVVRMRPGRCGALLGVVLPVERMVQLLGSLGLTPLVEQGQVACTIPTFRLDLSREVDLIEEVARLHGLSHIPVEAKMRIVVHRPQKSVQARQAVAKVLTAHGYCEAVTFSFLAPKLAEPFAGGMELVKVDEEKKKAEPALRPSVLPSLLACRKSNQDAGNKHVKLFEVAQTFGRGGGGYLQPRKLALVADAEHPADALRAMRGTLHELLDAMGLGLDAAIQREADTAIRWADPVTHIVRKAGGTLTHVIGSYGVVKPDIQKLFDLQTPVVLAELDYDRLVAAYPPSPRIAALPKFPAIERDLSVVVDEPVAWESITATIGKVNPALLEQVGFVTTYRGKPVPPGRKSVTLRMTFRDPHRTLKHEEVSEQVEAVVAAIGKELNAELRAN